MDLFTTFDIQRILDIKRTRLQEWLNKGFIRPSQQTPSIGVKALFSREDLYGIKLFEELLKLGHTRERAGKMIDYVLGYPMQSQKNPANWDSDYFNIYELSPDVEAQSIEKRIYKKHGVEPDETFGFLMSYSSMPETAKDKNLPYPIFMTLNIHLGAIKRMVDKRIE